MCTPERSSRALSVSSLGKQEKPGLLGIGTWKGDSPVVEQEEAGGQGDSELQPPPVRDGVGDGVEEQESDGESRLVEDPHRPAVLRAHHLCHCQGHGDRSVPWCPTQWKPARGALEHQHHGNALEKPW